jgi:hypothetical protein
MESDDVDTFVRLRGHIKDFLADALQGLCFKRGIPPPGV